MIGYIGDILVRLVYYGEASASAKTLVIDIVYHIAVFSFTEGGECAYIRPFAFCAETGVGHALVQIENHLIIIGNIEISG